MARKRDRIDLACEQWAAIRRQIDAGEFKHASDQLGATRCTLAEKRDLHHGSRTQKPVQHWPEVMTGDALAVARAWHRMNLTLREILAVHYGVRAPSKVKVARLGIGPRLYWDRLARAKTYVEAWIDHDEYEA